MPDFPFPGLNLAITTPFDASGRIDWTRLRGLVERYLAAGIKGFVLSSGTGMHVYLSKEESNELAQRGSSIINGRAKIIVQTSALLVEEVVVVIGRPLEKRRQDHYTISATVGGMLGTLYESRSSWNSLAIRSKRSRPSATNYTTLCISTKIRRTFPP